MPKRPSDPPTSSTSTASSATRRRRSAPPPARCAPTSSTRTSCTRPVTCRWRVSWPGVRQGRPARHAPRGYGCAGMSAVDYGLAASSWRRATRHPLAGVGAGQPRDVRHLAVRLRGAEAGVAAPDGCGEAIGCFGLTEPDHGSDPGSMRTRARRDGDDWVVNGSKTWITNGSIADVAVVWPTPARRTAASAASWCPPTPRGSRRTRSPTRCPCARRSPPSSPSRTCAFPRMPCCPTSPASRARSPGLSEARYGIVWGLLGAARSRSTPPAGTRWSASSSGA